MILQSVLRRVQVAMLLVPTIAMGASPQRLERAFVNGTLVEVLHNGEFMDRHFAVAVGNAVVTRFDADNAAIQGIYEEGKSSFALIEIPSSGSAGGSDFIVIDLTDLSRPVVSKPVGFNGNISSQPTIALGDLTLGVIDSSGTNAFKVLFHAGNLSITKDESTKQIIGPSKAPGGDMAAYLNGKSLKDALRTRFFYDLACATLGNKNLSILQEIASNPLGDTTFSVQGDFVKFSAARAHDAGKSAVVMADHTGHAWFYLSVYGKETFFGEPSARLKIMLKGS